MKIITNQQLESNENAEICYIYKENFEEKYAKDKNIVKLYREVAHSICNLRYSIPKEITIIFHNGSN